MAEQRSDEASVVPPAQVQVGATSAPAAEPTPGQLSDRINQAYASSGPILPDEPDTGSDGRGSVKPQKRPSSATAARFAAALANAKRAQSEPAGIPAAAPSGSDPVVDAGAATQTTQQAPAPAVRRPRRARVRLTHVDPWSVMKTAFLLSVAIGIVTVVAVAVLWSVLNAAGIWDSIDRAVSEISKGFKIEDYLGTSRVLGFTMLVAAVDVVLITVIATLGAFLYNLAAALLGGIEVVLAEDDH